MIVSTQLFTSDPLEGKTSVTYEDSNVTYITARLKSPLAGQLIMIGDGETFQDKFLNAELQPNTTYYVYFRAITIGEDENKVSTNLNIYIKFVTLLLFFLDVDDFCQQCYR